MDERIYGDDWSTDSDSSDDESTFSQSEPASGGAGVKNSRSFDNYSAYYCSADRPDGASGAYRHRSEGPANRYGIDQGRPARKYGKWLSVECAFAAFPPWQIVVFGLISLPRLPFVFTA